MSTFYATGRYLGKNLGKIGHFTKGRAYPIEIKTSWFRNRITVMRVHGYQYLPLPHTKIVYKNSSEFYKDWEDISEE